MLPIEWINKIFERLTLVYGKAFTDRWRDIDLDAVKMDWRRELARFESRPSALTYALDNLPEKPPTCVEFRNLCANAPAPRQEAKVIEFVPANKAKMAEALRQIDTTIKCAQRDPKGWAKRIIERHKAGDKVSDISLRFAKQALRVI